MIIAEGVADCRLPADPHPVGIRIIFVRRRNRLKIDIAIGIQRVFFKIECVKKVAAYRDWRIEGVRLAKAQTGVDEVGIVFV